MPEVVSGEFKIQKEGIGFFILNFILPDLAILCRFGL